MWQEEEEQQEEEQQEEEEQEEQLLNVWEEEQMKFFHAARIATFLCLTSKLEENWKTILKINSHILQQIQ